MIEKIDKNLLNKINSLSSNSNEIVDCLVYCKNINSTTYKINKITNIKNYYNFNFINAVGLKANIKNILRIAKLNEVEYISGNTKVFCLMHRSKKVLGIDNIDYSKLKSKNHSCAIIDTGIYPHLDLTIPKSRLVAFVDCLNDKKNFYDDNGHGTFVASVLGGNGIISNFKYQGIDPLVNIIGIKALDDKGEGGVFNILKAMQWIIDNKSKYNIKIVCMSFGSVVVEKNDPLILGAEALWKNGICVVCAAGNSGPDNGTIKSPAASTRIITVGALDDDRKNDKIDSSSFKVANFSSRGPILNNFKPDLIAPGVDVASCSVFKKTKVFYEKMSGTSIASPMVAGICSLIVRKYPNITPVEIKNLLLKNCVKINNDRNSEGFGWLNVDKIFKELKNKI